MPRRQSAAHHACELCRQRKRKCDGDGTNPCKACHEAGADCVYLSNTRVSKADLREQLARLQSMNSDNNTLLDAISSRNTTPAELEDIVRRLTGGQSRTEVATMITQRPNNQDSSSRSSSKDNSPSLSTPVPRSVSSASSAIVLESTQETPTSSLASEMTSPSTSESSFRASLPQYRAQLPQLLDTILTRDCLLFCPINRDDFTHDFESDSGPYCSTALTDSLLALATLLARHQMAAAVATRHPTSNPPDDLGNAFAEEAIEALYNGTGLPQRIADIQALGILSLYCLGRGKMKDGQGFAGDFCAAITDQWRSEQPLRSDSNSFADRHAHANMYCAAISLNRLLFLIQDYNKTLDELAVRVGMEVSDGHEDNDSPSSDANLSGSIIDDGFFARDLTLTPNSPRVIAAKLFEVTELIYRAQYNTAERSFNQAMEAYQEGLRWYESFFAYTSCCDSDTPLVLFAHTFYHFCVLCLLTPYVVETADAGSDDGTTRRTTVVCRQAANSIEQLMQHNSKLCGDGQLQDFMPSFHSASRSFLEIFETKM